MLSNRLLPCALLTYGGVSLFVVVFAVYPFAADALPCGKPFPKRLIPGTIALGAFPSTMDALPNSLGVKNIAEYARFFAAQFADRMGRRIDTIDKGYIAARNAMPGTATSANCATSWSAA